MLTPITHLIYTESGGFAGLQRGCTIEPHALPPEPFGQLQGLAQQAQAQATAAATATANVPSAALQMPDMQVYTLELVSQNPTVQEDASHHSPTRGARHWVLQYPASDVPDEVTELIDFLHEHAAPLPPS
jgi:hypothetical protein